ncbi:MAG: hypothetical protein LUG44_06845 [Clostridiales bacterium]|nr:hypothetical protein [Clostridiales bacterium]
MTTQETTTPSEKSSGPMEKTVSHCISSMIVSARFPNFFTSFPRVPAVRTAVFCAHDGFTDATEYFSILTPEIPVQIPQFCSLLNRLNVDCCTKTVKAVEYLPQINWKKVLAFPLLPCYNQIGVFREKTPATRISMKGRNQHETNV